LPAGIDPPVVAKLDPDSTPILTLAVTGPGDARDITELADKTIRREIESLNGVGQVTVVGGRARQINVWVDPVKLEKYEMSGGQLEHALRTQNVELPSGRVEKGETQLTLRTLGRVQSIQQLADVTVAMRAGQPIRLRDVARVEDGMAEAESAGFRGTSPTVLLNLRKQSGTNTVEVVERVKERIRDLAPRLPAGASIEVARDQSEFIGNAIATVKEHLIVGALLASIVVLLFLRNWRSTLIAAIAIPVSVISTFALMKSAGFTLNVITMLGLTLAVGIVIDDAIVVLENIYRHIEEKGATPYQAAIDGTKEIGLAVLATTISLVAVFLPVAFMGGIVGRFMNSFGLTMAFAIMISLLVSFVLTPMMSARWLRPAAAAEGEVAHAHGSKSSRFYAPIEAGYMRLLGFSMRHRWVIVIATLATLASTPVLAGLANKNFLPDEDESQFMANIRLPEGTSLDATRIAATRLAGDIGKLEGVKYAITTRRRPRTSPTSTPN
jgi:HAE1 family hydrophobic/amphiphilic exporter-1